MDKELSMRIAEAIHNVAAEYEMQIGLLGMVDLTVSVTEAVENYIADQCFSPDPDGNFDLDDTLTAYNNGYKASGEDRDMGILDLPAYDEGYRLGVNASSSGRSHIEIYNVDGLASAMTDNHDAAESFALGVRHGMQNATSNG